MAYGMAYGYPFLSGKAGGNPFTPILDLYAGATMGFSLLQISSTYTGYCIKVRRSSDNTEAFIGFKNGALDTVALLAFCGSGNGIVTMWCDQSGNGKHATQATALLQPQIVSNGAVIMEGGKPTILFNNTYLEVPTTNVDNISTAYQVSQKSLETDSIISFGTNNNVPFSLHHASGNQMRYSAKSNQRTLNTTVADYSLLIFAAKSTSINFELRHNTNLLPFTIQNITLLMNVQFVGAFRLDIRSINGKLSECVLWSGQELNLTELSDDVNTNYNAY